MGVLSGTRVVVAGAGLAGLTAAYELGRRGAEVHVFEARNRLGGRVWTQRDSRGELHVEAGGEFIDADQSEIRELARMLSVPLTRILKGGFGLALNVEGSLRVSSTQHSAWVTLTRKLKPAIDALKAARCDWNSATASAIARLSFSEALDRGPENRRLIALAEAFRGFYLADPDELSALVVVEQAATGSEPGRSALYRAADGNDALIEALARRVRGRVSVNRVVRAMQVDSSHVLVTLADEEGHALQTTADYAVVALPSTLVLDCHFSPALPSYQQAALQSLNAGAASKVSLRFRRKWWRHKPRPWAYGTNLPIGALWDGAEDQRGANVLTFLAGGSASRELKQALDADGPRGLVDQISWMGTPLDATFAAAPVSWEDEPWSRGGYAVFPPSFDPRLRAALSANHGRVVFAGEHTSRKWQGFMNGAVESGQRAAREIEMLQRFGASF